MKAIYYNTKSGLITKAIEASLDTVKANLGKDEAYIEGDLNDKDMNEFMVAGNRLVAKPEMRVSVVGKTITGIPANTTACINAQGFIVVNDGSVELDATYSGEAIVTLNNPAYKATTLKVPL